VRARFLDAERRFNRAQCQKHLRQLLAAWIRADHCRPRERGSASAANGDGQRILSWACRVAAARRLAGRTFRRSPLLVEVAE
jgi:hypothetical protein